MHLPPLQKQSGLSKPFLTFEATSSIKPALITEMLLSAPPLHSAKLSLKNSPLDNGFTQTILSSEPVQGGTVRRFILDGFNNKTITTLNTANSTDVAILKGYEVEIWDCKSGTLKSTIRPADPETGETPTSIAYGGEVNNGGGSILAVGTSKGNLELWNTNTGTKFASYPVASIDGKPFPIHELRYLEQDRVAVVFLEYIDVRECNSGNQSTRIHMDMSHTPINTINYCGNGFISCGFKETGAIASINYYNNIPNLISEGTKLSSFNCFCQLSASENSFLAGNAIGEIYFFNPALSSTGSIVVKTGEKIISMAKLPSNEVVFGTKIGLYKLNTNTWEYVEIDHDNWFPIGICPPFPDGSFATASGQISPYLLSYGLLKYTPPALSKAKQKAVPASLIQQVWNSLRTSLRR